MTHPFINSLIRDWLFNSIEISGEGSIVLTEGFGPFDQVEFNEFLDKHGFLAFSLAANNAGLSEILIIGQFGWSENSLFDLLVKRAGKTLKVYSQEMFLSYLLTDNDPFSCSIELLRSFAEGHPALEYLMGLGFEWPSTIVSPSLFDLEDTNWPKVGLLKYMGYKVGRSGIQDAKKRQKILSKVFKSKALPLVDSRSYMAEWGNPKTCKRLQKIAKSLASFCCNAKRRKAPLQLAIEHWETDLNWLKKKYYRGHCNFKWPSTKIH